MEENRTCPNYKWEEIPTAELDKILQTELEKEQPDERVVLPILKELEHREKNYPISSKEMENLSDKLYVFNPKKAPRKRNWVIAASAVAAVMCIVMAFPRTVGAESIFGALFRWTSSVFQFIDPDGEGKSPEIDNNFSTNNPGLQKLYEEVANQGVTEKVVPTWLPEGYELISLKTMEAPSGTKINAVFQLNNKTVMLTYRFSPETISEFEKEDSKVEVFECARMSHYILENDDNLSATWITEKLECSLITTLDKNSVYNIIQSIYKGKLK